MTEDKDKTKENEANQPEFAVERLYIKDISFEAPHTPEIFKTEWHPELNLELNTNSQKLGDDLYEVVLKPTVTVKIGDKTAFLVEVQQAGIFLIKNFDEKQMHQMLGSYCPSILFPYVREIVSEMVTRGGFPPLYLAPINFDALYHQQMEQQETDKAH